MSNFNVTVPNVGTSAISLGGEWRNTDRMEANKYKISGLANRSKKKVKISSDGKGDQARPTSEPSSQQQRPRSSPRSPVPSSSAPPGIKPRCDRVYEVEHEPTARKQLDSHLPLKKTRPVTREDQSGKQYRLGPGMVLSKGRSKVAVKITTEEGEDGSRGMGRTFQGMTGDAEQDGFYSLLQQQTMGSPDSQSKYQKLLRQSLMSGGVDLSNFFPDEGNESNVPPGYRTRTPRPNTRASSAAVGLQEALIFQLQQQVSDLTLFLEEERLSHKATKDKLAITLKEKLQDLDRKQLEELRAMQQDQDEQLDMMKHLHTKELEHHKSASNSVLARMKGELEFLQGAFEAYKGTLVQDMEEKWAKKEGDMKMRFQEDLDKALYEQRTEMLEEANRDKKAINREFQRQIQILNRDHKKEIEGLMNRFSSTSADLASLKRALEQLKQVRAQLEEKSEQLAVTQDSLHSCQQERQQLQSQLTVYKMSFQDKVDQVDDKYQERIHLLMTENAELRRRYLQKCDELFTEKSATEVKRVEKAMNTKELMQMLVHVKNRANINLACADPATDGKPRIPLLRPVSAPSTKREAVRAFRQAGETEHLTKLDGQRSGLRRPHTTYGGHRHSLTPDSSAYGNAQGMLFTPVSKDLT